MLMTIFFINNLLSISGFFSGFFIKLLLINLLSFFSLIFFN